jgi:hypothetical protein
VRTNTLNTVFPSFRFGTVLIFANVRTWCDAEFGAQDDAAFTAWITGRGFSPREHGRPKFPKWDMLARSCAVLRASVARRGAKPLWRATRKSLLPFDRP